MKILTKKNRRSSLLTIDYPDSIYRIEDPRFCKQNRDKLQTSSGYALIEIIVASAIIAISLFGLLGAGQHYVLLARENHRSVQARFLVEEGLEALRSMRDENYTRLISPLIENTAYYLYWNGSQWISTTTPQIIAEFTRDFTIAHVFRNTNDDIVESGGTDDPDTRKIHVRVFWTSVRGGTTEKVADTYVTNYFR